MDGEVIVGRIRTKPVHLVTVRRSDITRPDWQIQDWSPEHLAARSSGSLSLSPEALLEAARRSTGERVEVEGPIQLIVYGVPEAE